MDMVPTSFNGLFRSGISASIPLPEGLQAGKTSAHRAQFSRKTCAIQNPISCGPAGPNPLDLLQIASGT